MQHFLFSFRNNNSDHLLLHPPAADKADAEEQRAHGPIQEHAHPDEQQAAVELEHHQVAEGHPEHPHGDDADRHGKGGVSGGAQDVGQGEAGGPQDQRYDVEPDHQFQCHAVGLRREVEPEERQLVQEEQAGKIHHPVPGVGGQEQQAGIALGLHLFPGTQTLAHNGQRADANGGGGHVQEAGDVACHGVCRNGGGAQRAGQAGDRQLADLEHAVLDAGGNADLQDALDEVEVRLQVGEVVDAQRTVRLLQQEHHGEAGDHPAHEAGGGRTHHAHAEPVDQDGVAANVHHVHHQAGKHTDLAVALGAEQSRTGVVHANKRIAQG